MLVMCRTNSIPIAQKAVHLFRPFSMYIQPYIQAISEKEKVVEECARMATMKRTMGMLDCQSALEIRNGLSI